MKIDRLMLERSTERVILIICNNRIVHTISKLDDGVIEIFRYKLTSGLLTYKSWGPFIDHEVLLDTDEVDDSIGNLLMSPDDVLKEIGFELLLESIE